MKIRSEAEEVKLNSEALNKICEIGQITSLRYVFQLLTPAKLLAQIAGREIVEVNLF